MEQIDLQGQPLDLDLTLSCGQAFRWAIQENGVWQGVVGDRLIEVAMDSGYLLWQTHPGGGIDLIRDYFRLDDDVNSIYAYLSERDPHITELLQKFNGLRILRQDPVETLLSFVCSAANSIPRIMAAIDLLSIEYGDLVCERESLCYYAFPRLEHLAESEQLSHELNRALGFRGDNIRMVARQVIGNGGRDWLMSLREMNYSDAKSSLMKIKGVGPKIADCVCLFSLDKDVAVPVDTHVRQLAHRLFLPEMRSRTVTDAVYRKVVEAFEDRYGKYAGWAQEFLYFEDLLRTRAMGRGLT